MLLRRGKRRKLRPFFRSSAAGVFRARRLRRHGERRFVGMLSEIEVHFVYDEEFAADEEEIDEPHDDIGKRGARKPEIGADLRHAARKENDEERHARHDERIELAHPCDHDARKAHISVHRGAYHLVDTGNEKESDQPAQRARKGERTDDDLFDVDARIPRGILALADDGDLISVLEKAEITEDERRDEHRNDDGKQALARLTGT